MNTDPLLDEHTRSSIAARLSKGTGHSYLGDMVLGAVDGAVTTFAIVAGAAGAGLSNSIVVVLGIANVLADGFSMAAGNYLRTRSSQQELEKYRRLEEMHIEKVPEGEREEIRQIFAAKGFEGELLEGIVEHITGDRRRWINTMLTEEWGLQLDLPSATRSAWATFAAFVAAGAVPMLPALLFLETSARTTFLASAIATGLAFLLIGIVRGRAVARNALMSGIETLAIGGTAAAVAFLVGWFLRIAGAGV